MRSLKHKKSRSFLSRSPSMEPTMIPKPEQGGEIFHHSHPQHPLQPINLPYLFSCMGCKEYGAGKRFRCQRCEFELHEFCALAPPSLQDHPFHNKHQLVFFTRPAGGSKCDVCGKSAKGYAFHCTACGFMMHPCCATMRREMTFPTHQHLLSLSPSAVLTGGDSSAFCEICRRKRSGQVYCCVSCGYYVHAICAKDMVNGLYLHGIRPPTDKKNMLGAAARLASQAFLGIIGGLIEGIGEGIGEVLIQSIGRGSRTKSIRRT